MPTRSETAFEVSLTPDQSDRLKGDLGLSALRKLRLRGTLAPAGRHDWVLTAELGATVVQPCGITLDPVTTRIDQPVRRRYVVTYNTPDAAETEIPEDDSVEPLPETVDLVALIEEELALALPAFPRAPGAEIGEVDAAPPGAAAFEEGKENPFAALADLKRSTDET